MGQVQRIPQSQSNHDGRTYETQREKMYLLTYKPNEDTNQPVHPDSLVSLYFQLVDTLHTWLS